MMRTLLLLYLCAYVAWAQDDLEYDDYDTVSVCEYVHAISKDTSYQGNVNTVLPTKSLEYLLLIISGLNII